MGKYNILNVTFNNITKSELLENFTEGILFTPNIDVVLNSHNIKDVYEAYQHASYVVCDSKVIGLFSPLAGIHIKEVIPGSSFFAEYYNFHKDDLSCKIFLLGAKKGVAEIAMKNINSKIGRNIVVGVYSPPLGFEKDSIESQKIVDIVDASRATVVVTGFSEPKQPIWIANNYKRFHSAKSFLALGSTIDFEAGIIKNVPVFYRKYALEWFYRIFSQPKRTIPRVIRDLSFFGLFLKQILGCYNNPFINSEK